MKGKSVRKLTILVVVMMFCAGASGYAQDAAIPIPKSADIVIWMRGDQVASDPDLKTAILRNRGVGHYLDLLNLALEQVDYAVVFSPFDDNIHYGGGRSAGNALPKSGAFIVAGNFDPKAKIDGFKSKGWIERKYANKKLLWWSTGESYYRNPGKDEYIGYLPGGRLVVTRSESVMKDILDISGDKLEGLTVNETFSRISEDFFSNPKSVISCYMTVTDQFRELVKNDSVIIKSQTLQMAAEYIDHLREFGLSSARESDDFDLSALLGMDSQNNALVVAGMLQLGGGLASFLPPEDPNREILTNISISRETRIVLVRSVISQRQLSNLLK